MGYNTKNSIDINGKRYDAVTGSFVGSSPSQPIPARPSQRSGGASMDGFMRVSRGVATGPLKPIPAHKKPLSHPVASAVRPQAPAIPRKAHQPGISTTAHTQQRATTLMRSAVKKPVIKSPSVIKAQTRTDILAKVPMQTVVPKMSYNTINPVRHRRAERMMKSPAVSRYASVVEQSSSFAITPLAHPVTRPVPQHKVSPAVGLSPSAQPAALAAQRVPSPAHTGPRSMSDTLQPTRITPASRKPDMFEKAIASATSHEQTFDHKTHKQPRAKKRGRFLRFASASLILLLLLGVIAYKNIPNLSLKVASYRAGFQAKLPAEEPSGYTFGYLDYQPGNVTANFTSPQDGRQFNITQKASTWDSQALLNNFVTSANSAYKTYQRAGRTVYLLGNNTATWVDSGIWFTVDGNSSLSSKQLLDLATTM